MCCSRSRSRIRDDSRSGNGSRSHSLSLSLPQPQPQPASASACFSLSLSLSQHSKCGPGMEFWELEEHEVAYSWLRAFKMWPGNGVLGNRRARSGLQLAPGIQNVAREWNSGNSKSTKCVTVASGYSKCGPGMAFWDVEEHEVCDCCIRLF